MPKRTDIKSILILGAGPIVIGQACEFDYSGAQACKALREEGYRVILVNSNPATIMTDPEMADATYIEPIHWEVVRKIIEKERPDAVLPTMGGQTALNCALELERQGVLEEFGVTMIGATADAIDKAEDRRRFDVAMKKIGLETARSGIAHTMEEALAVAADVGFPCIIRPSFTMGGSGGGIAYNREEFEEICARGLDLSPTKELLIDESLIGWKEYEMEVVRDKNDNCIIVCSIENFDAMGIHTGDSITVAPAQTLTDKEYQIMRNASLALREDGYETIMVNCNPETVSTDYDTSDRLYFEPVTLEDVLEIVRIEKPKGVIVQYGGQTPLKLARALEAAGVPVIGTSPDAIDRAEDRERFQHAVERLKLKQPANATVTAIEMAVEKAKEIGYPLVVRPSYVLGGRAMEIVYDEADLRRYFQTAVSVSNDAPVLLDHFLDDAVEVDVDAICDGEMVLIGGIMEHIEQAGVHSGDSACSLPAYTLSQEIQDVMRQQVQKLAFELQVRGLMNVQFAVKNNEVYLIEVNPRAARTVPFVSKATGVPLAKVAARVMAGKSLAEQGVTKEVIPPYYSVKEVVLPFNKFPGVDPLLGPEMRSTGEVMGVGRTFAEAFAKAQLGSNSTMKKHGRALLSVREGDKERVVDLAAKLLKQGFELDATHGTAIVLGEAGINPRLVNKVHEGRPHIQDRIKNGEYTYIINTTSGRRAIEDSRVIRRSALQYKVHYDTTLNGGFATAMALNADATEKVISVQEMHAQIK